MEALAILSVIFGFIVVKLVFDHRAERKRESLRLLEQAMKSPSLDRATIETLSYQLTGQRPLRAPGPNRLLATVLALGWVTLFTGLGIWAIGAVGGDGDVSAGGMLTAIIGFGLVTYPFALRELEARRQT